MNCSQVNGLLPSPVLGAASMVSSSLDILLREAEDGVLFLADLFLLVVFESGSGVELPWSIVRFLFDEVDPGVSFLPDLVVLSLGKSGVSPICGVVVQQV